MLRPMTITLILLLSAGAVFAYPTNLLSHKLGASVTTQAVLDAGNDVSSILSDGPISRGGFSFAAGKQEHVFTVDLGQVREFDRIDFGSAGTGNDRNAPRVVIEISASGPNGPYKKVFRKADLGSFQVLRLRSQKARWVRFDVGGDPKGAYVHSVRIYKGYKHPGLVEVTRLLQERIKPDLPGLGAFYSASASSDWPKACRALRAYFAETQRPDGPPDPKYDLARVKKLAAGQIDFAGLARQERFPIDWSYMRTNDWYEHRNFLNRGAPLGVPADAYYHTGDRRWARMFRRIFYDWVEENPKPAEMSRADYPTWRTLDSAARSGWLISRFAKVTAGKAIDDELWANYLYSIWEHADYLKNDTFDGGNWLATVTVSVMEIALKFPEFRDQWTWLAFGKEGFETNVLRDVNPDGKEKEDAPGYVCMAYSGMFGTLQALERAGIAVQPETRNRLNKVLDFVGAVIQPNGDMPSIGDWGGGPVPYDMVTPSRYFKREDTRYILTLGKEGKVPAAASVNFPDGGWTVMRSAYEENPYGDARHLVFKTSCASHGHLDCLEMTAYAYGRELLIDPGISSYEAADVDRYLQTSYHNTICVDGRNQSRGAGRTEKWVTNADIDYVRGSHNDYKGLEHRREIVFAKPDYWLVVDTVTGEGTHTYDQNWHFPADAKPVEDAATRAVHTTFATGANLLIVPLDADSLKSEAVDFLIATRRMSGEQDTPSKGWRYTRSGPAPQRFETLIYPYQGPKPPDVSFKRLDASTYEVRIGDKVERLLVSDDGVTRQRVQTTSSASAAPAPSH